MQSTKIYLIVLLALCLFTACKDSSQPNAEIKALEAQLEEAKASLAAAQSDGNFIHTVFVWMKEDLNATERAQFETDLKSLEKIESVKRFYWGKAAGSEKREVVDNSYDYALIIHFKDLAGHDVYQPHELHQAFVANNSSLWTKVVVYDSLVE